MVRRLYVLYEHASGYALFRVKQFEEIGALNVAQVESSHQDSSLFLANVKLVAFSPFESALNALENANAISDGYLNADLKVFLDNHLPAGEKRSKIMLGLAFGNLAQAVNEQMCLSVKTGDSIGEILRGIRSLFTTIIKDLTPAKERQAQLGLGHAFSRSKIKFNVNRADNMIIHSISLLDQLDKDINTFSMRIREWYGYHFPELFKIVPDNYTYAKIVLLIGDRLGLKDRLTEDEENVMSKLDDLTMDSTVSKAIVSASKSSMGMELSEIDFENIILFSKQVADLHDYRKELFEYLTAKMGCVAPNLTAIVGEQVGARLISHAGSLTNLAKYPASTIQILGAEKALFRALKTRSATPKYGLLFHSPLIGKANRNTKGRVSRNLANKCAIASRIDCFSDVPTNCYGEKLRELVEQRLKYFHEVEYNGEAKKPPLTYEVMDRANIEADAKRQAILEKAKRKALRKAKKLAAKEAETNDTDAEIVNITESVTKVRIRSIEMKSIEDFDESLDIDE